LSGTGLASAGGSVLNGVSLWHNYVSDEGAEEAAEEEQAPQFLAGKQG